MKIKTGIIGAGILGLAVAYKIREAEPDTEIYLFDKESGPGMHQSGRNSGVLHCGLSYEPGSLKAHLAVSGIREMVEFCRKNGIDHELCGKVVVASGEREEGVLEDLARRGAANGLKGLTFLSSSKLEKREPHVKASAALFVPEEGIVDYKGVMGALASRILENGGNIAYNTRIGGCAVKRNREFIVIAGKREFVVDRLINCAGLHADQVYQSCTNMERPLHIVPFRGEYLRLKPDAEYLVNHLVYPVPDPAYPFLGVHFTRMIHGGREVGPNAVLAFKREGYSWRDFSFRDSLDTIAAPGFREFLKRNFHFAAREFSSSLFKSSFLEKARHLIPDITADQLEPGQTGVRAQAIENTGVLAMDFRIVSDGSQVHVLNAPSPGATASLAIAGYIVKNYIHLN